MRTKGNLHSSWILPCRRNCEASLPSCVNVLVHVHVHVVIVVVVVVLIVDCVDDGHREEGGGDEEAKEREDDEGATVAWVVAIPGRLSCTSSGPGETKRVIFVYTKGIDRYLTHHLV